MAEAVRTRLGLSDGDNASLVGDRIDAALLEFVPSADQRDWLRPRLAALLGTPPPEGRLEELFSAWATFLERLSQDGNAVVLVIDDAQHADDGLLDFLDHMLSAARAPIFVVALARPELLLRRPTLGGRRATVVRLDALDDPAMAELVDGLVVGLPTEARAALVARSEGVPLFAVETVRALIDRDAIVPKGGRVRLGAGRSPGFHRRWRPGLAPSPGRCQARCALFGGAARRGRRECPRGVLHPGGASRTRRGDR